MYHAHFGLERTLFGDGIAADTAVFRSPKHALVLANFKLALESPSSVIVLRGPPGVGKTTLTSAALRAGSPRLALAWLNGTPTNAPELLELLLVELGIGTLRTSRIERLQLWRQFQAEMLATESRLFVVAERCEDLSHEVLHALDSLTAPDTAGHPGANVVLIGHLNVDTHLGAPVLESLRQRIRLRAQLETFTAAELQDYLRHQVACAGGHYDRIFAPGAVAALHRYSGGVARAANHLCETALTLAAGEGQKLLTAELIATTAVSVLGLAEPAPVASAASVELARRAAAPESTASVDPSTAPPAVAPKTNAAIPPAPLSTPAPAPVPAKTPLPATALAPATRLVSPPPAVPEPARPLPSPPVAVALDPVAIPAPQTAAPNATPAQRAPATATPPSPPYEFDGSATDIPDVSMDDFPVLTDAVESPAAASPPPALPPPMPRAAAPGSAERAAARPPVAAGRIETAYTTPSPAPSPKPTPTPAVAPKPLPAAVTPKPLPAAAAPTASQAPPPPVAMAEPSSEDDDVLRQTQTMRAIAVAKSIDDISSSMAETLFGDAELDLLTAALASAADWTDSEASTTAPAPAPKAAAPKSPPPKTKPPTEDPFDLLFDLGSDAPLELIDDSKQPPAAARKAATQG